MREARRAPLAVEAIRRREAEHARGDALVVREQVRAPRAPRAPSRRRSRGSTRVAARAGLAQPEAAGEDVRANRLLPAPLAELGERGLVDRLRREAQVERLAVRLLHAAERVEEEPLELAPVRGLGVDDARAARCRSPGVIVDWCAPPSRESEMPDGRAEHDEAAARVERRR